MVVFTQEFTDFLKTQADTYQGAESDGSPAGELNYAEWCDVWAKAQDTFSDVPAGSDVRDQVGCNEVKSTSEPYLENKAAFRLKLRSLHAGLG